MMRRNLLSSIAMMIALILPLDGKAEANAEDSVAGLYVGFSGGSFTWSNQFYLYLFPDGTFYDGFIAYGYDGFNLSRHLSTQHPLRVAADSGRYVLHGNTATFRYGDGKEKTIEFLGNMLMFPVPHVRQPDCDGLKLSGTYRRADIGYAAIMFTSDGRFVDQGLMKVLPLTNIRPSPGSGTYSIKNYTLTLRYDHGAILRTLFHRERSDRDDNGLSTIYIDVFPLIRQDRLSAEQSSISVAHLPKIEAPPGWKSQYDPSAKRTNLIPANLPKGRTALVTVTDPTPLDRNVAQVPGRVHDAFVQELAKGYVSQGMRAEQTMTRQDVGTLPSSTGIFVLPDGKKWWITAFSVIAATEGQAILLVSDAEDLHQSYLPTVRAMLGDGDFSSGVGQ